MMRTIKQFIAEHLINTEIFEMAQSLAEYKREIEDKLPILLAHILLVMKANEEHSTEFVEHWKKEIRGFIRSLSKRKLKVKDNYQARLKYISDVIIRQYEIDTEDDYIWDLSHKLNLEGYDLENNEIYNDFINLWHKFQDELLDKFIDTIASNDEVKINQFTDKI